MRLAGLLEQACPTFQLYGWIGDIWSRGVRELESSLYWRRLDRACPQVESGLV